MKKKLPKYFKFLLWSYDFSRIDPQEDIERVIINTINYGDWKHWQWVIRYYGEKKVKKIIENTPASEFRERTLKLISLVLKIKSIKHESRGAQIRAERDIS